MNLVRSLGADLWGRFRRLVPWILAAIFFVFVRGSGVRVTTAGLHSGRPVVELRFPGWEPRDQKAAAKPIQEVEFLMAHRRPEIASRVLLAALDKDPSNPYLAVRLEEVLLELGDWDRARRLLSELDNREIPSELVASVQASRAKFREHGKP